MSGIKFAGIAAAAMCIFSSVASTQEAVPPANLDSSYVIISAIKSVAGQKPANEFFDINLKLLFEPEIPLIGSFHGMLNGSFDVAMSAVGTDSVTGTAKKFTEGGILMNYGVNTTGPRTAMVGTTIKVFAEIPYVGFHLGGMELKASKLTSSYIYISYLWRVQGITPQNQFYDGIEQSFHDFYAEFAIYSNDKGYGLLNSLRIKGGMLMPIKKGKVTGINSRIVIEVPIGGILYF